MKTKLMLLGTKMKNIYNIYNTITCFSGGKNIMMFPEMGFDIKVVWLNASLPVYRIGIKDRVLPLNLSSLTCKVIMANVYSSCFLKSRWEPDYKSLSIVCCLTARTCEMLLI